MPAGDAFKATSACSMALAIPMRSLSSLETTSLLALIAALVATAVLLTGGDGELWGAVSESPDGKTYLAVDDNDGGYCVLLRVHCSSGDCL